MEVRRFLLFLMFSLLKMEVAVPILTRGFSGGATGLLVECHPLESRITLDEGYESLILRLNPRWTVPWVIF